MNPILLENLADTRNLCVAATKSCCHHVEMSIHTRIKQRRIDCGFSSHEAFAKAVGVSWQTVQQWEKEGGTAPNRGRMEKVAKALETTPEWLLYGTDGATGAESGAPAKRANKPALQWVYEDEVELLSLYRASTQAAKETLLTAAEALPKDPVIALARNNEAQS